MQNETLINAARGILKSLIVQCSLPQQQVFTRMYSPKNFELPIEEVIQKMDPSKMDNAITQCERTISRNS